MNLRHMLALAAACVGTIAGAGELSVKMKPGENWWGLGTDFGRKMPFTEKTSFDCDLRVNNYAHQTQSLLVSDLGRAVWCEEPVRAQIANGTIRLTSDAAPVQLVERAGTNVREALEYAARTWYRPSGEEPDLLYFAAPQYNTWIELTYHQNEKDILAYAQAMRDNGLPPGIFMIDDTWQLGYGTWEFDPRRFSDPKGMVAKLHKMGYKVLLWTCPWVSMDSPEFRRIAHGVNPDDVKGWPTKGGFLTKQPATERNPYPEPAPTRWWNGYSALLDFTHTNAVSWYAEQLDRLRRDYGVDAFKFDGGSVSYYAGTVDSSGEGGSAPVTYAHDRSATPARQSALYGDFALRYKGSEYRNGFGFAGKPVIMRLHDKDHSWDALRRLIPDMLAAGFVGIPFICPDMVGGGSWTAFLPGAPFSEELFVRSAQVQALCPMMQFSASPWRYLKPENQKIIRETVALRQKYAPRLVALAKRAAKDGQPMMRSLEYAFPHRGYAAIRDEFMMGPDLLVAPVVTEGATSRTVVLPPGTWRGDDGVTYAGGQTVTVAAPLGRIPHFERLGPLPLAKLRGIDRVPQPAVSADSTAAEFEIPPMYERPWIASRYDLPVELDLTGADGLAFEYRCSDSIRMSNPSLLLASPKWKGYYSVPFRTVGEKDGWTRIEILRESFRTFEGAIDGWHDIRTLRFYFTPQPNVRKSLTCAIRNLEVLPVREPDAEAWVVQGDLTFREMNLAGIFADVGRKQRDALKAAGVRTRTVFESDFIREVPAGVRLVVLPYNRHLPESHREILRRFADRGGKILFSCNQVAAFQNEIVRRGAGRQVGFDWIHHAVSQLEAEYEKLIGAWFPDLAPVAARRRAAAAAALAPRARALARRAGRAGERCFLDCHDAYGPDPDRVSWEEAVAFAATNGVTDLIVNFSWAATAFYKSDVLEVSPKVAERGDAIDLCLAACRKWGVKLHAWRCCWASGTYVCSSAMKKRLQDEGRFQTDIDGKTVSDFLCPNHPANHRMHVESMVELAKRGVDGIDYDFIRYNASPNRTCFCAHCRTAFERELGHSLTNWPKQVVDDRALFEAWGEFRARSIGRGIREIAERVRREVPQCEISSTGGGDGTTYRISYGRDWLTWARNGWVDFVFTMDYTSSAKGFSRLMESRRALDIGKAFLVPGLGPSCWPCQTPVEDAEIMADEVDALRAAGCRAWGIFCYDRRTFGYLPLLRLGTLSASR